MVIKSLKEFLETLDLQSGVEIFTDGACSGNPGPGGWGAVLRSDGNEAEIWGGERQTTNNRMEMKAAVHSLSTLPAGKNITLFTDSQYLKNGITSWIENWKKNGWKTFNKQPVKNQDLWQELDTLTSIHIVNWKWVKGHAGHPDNERADALARRGVIAQHMVS